MPNTTSFDFADIVLVPFPFTDQSTTKKRQAVVVSPGAYHQQRPDIILMAITSQFRPAATVGEIVVQHWHSAGLIKPSVLKPLLATVEARLVIRTIGKLHADDRTALRKAIDDIIGDRPRAPFDQARGRREISPSEIVLEAGLVDARLASY